MSVAMISESTTLNETVILDEPLQREAGSLVRKAGGMPMDGLLLRVGGKETEIPSPLAKLLIHVIKRAAEGGAMTIKAMPEEVTTTVAAEMLGISRPTLMKMIAAGELRGHKAGTHTRLASQEVLALARVRRDSRKKAFDRMRELADELGEE